MPAGGKPTVRSRRLGAELRKLREAAGLTTARVASILACSQPKISRMETGAVTTRVIDLRVLLDHYGVTDPHRRAYLERLAKDGNRQGWWEPYGRDTIAPYYADFIGLEWDAQCIRTWQSALIPGLLQTAGYARTVMRANPAMLAPERSEQLLDIRRERQARIETDAGLRLHAIIWEPAVTSVAGTPAIHREQLESLLTVGERDNVTIQILPTSPVEHAGMSGPFVMFSFDRRALADTVFLEDLTGSHYLEKPEELSGYALVFDALRTAAHSAADSAALMTEVLRKAEKRG
ncbi:helix-turn-helix domain-containing protein [Embleya hyalina]|uniref:Transcriptional regulator n=1 Tax=Embleya hyalina TaxID=516124 RepID=A0A401Z3D7_9ACTN|nr:helix-turn-helix transcriptional regulator [Embleya hyalina]GCE01377.1 transcriptional regulator [Embleya hyalina]